MSRKTRLRLIEEIEKTRKSRVLCFLTGDRRGFETRIHPEVHTMLYDHLQKIGEVDKIDLFLYSTGGITMAAWSIVNLIREFCREFTVIVPFKAFSTATLVCLGADKIIMGKLGQLGPVDPSVNTPFNPPIPGAPPGNVLPISVEEVANFINFAKDKDYCELKSEDTLKDVLRQLTDKVHPLTIGSVYRAIEQIKILSTKLLKLHMTEDSDTEEITRIVKDLTKNLFSHDYIINRSEAKKEIRLKVENAVSVSQNFDKLIFDLFSEYEREMCLTKFFTPDVLLGSEDTARDTFYRAFIESTSTTHAYITEKEFTRVTNIPQQHVLAQDLLKERIIRDGWEKITK